VSVVLDEEVRDTSSFDQLLGRLSSQSLTKRFDAYLDVPWDEPGYEIDHDDPRWELGPDDVLGATSWYQAQPAGVRSRIGLHGIVSNMKTGLQFESILKRGLLEYAAKLPNQSPEFRYAYHEVIEEAQHSLMFQEFVNRSGIDVPGLPPLMAFGARRVIVNGRRFPELFFIFVLGGEDPIDHVQRQALRSEREINPLLERIMRIHVTEEARHLSFARHYLKTRVPQLNFLKRTALAVQAPFILGTMSQLMLKPSSQIVKTYGIPKEVIREAYTDNPVHKAKTIEALTKVRRLCEELGLITPVSKQIWKALGIWSA
jgi:hypothetical protein